MKKTSAFSREQSISYDTHIKVKVTITTYELFTNETNLKKPNILIHLSKRDGESFKEFSVLGDGKSLQSKDFSEPCSSMFIDGLIPWGKCETLIA